LNVISKESGMIGAMLSEAWVAMTVNRMRTFLTMLGMVIGVGAVIMMLAIGQGVQRKVEDSIASMGSNLFIILSGSTTSGGARMGGGAAPTLTVNDAEALRELPELAAVAPAIPGTAQIIYGPNNWSTRVYGTTPDYLTVRDWGIARGVSFTESDVRSATRVALLGQTVVQNLFGGEDPVGKTIRIAKSPYVVLGVLTAKGQSLDGRDQDDTVLVPVTTAQRKLFGSQFQGTVRFIMAQAVSAAAMPAAEKAMTDLLHQRHHIRQGQDDDFSIRNLTAMANTAAETTQVLSLMLGAIASISLLVGGIGIMNIMLVSVTERTREIGIRMAIGARGQDVLLQFLLEAVMISLIGCFIGVLLGVGGALVVQQLTGLVVVVTVLSIVMAFGVAAAVGIFFGWYPARKASRLRPIDALRYQ
jgi:putative ABC transport system permease protein